MITVAACNGDLYVIFRPSDPRFGCSSYISLAKVWRVGLARALDVRTGETWENRVVVCEKTGFRGCWMASQGDPQGFDICSDIDAMTLVSQQDALGTFFVHLFFLVYCLTDALDSSHLCLGSELSVKGLSTHCSTAFTSVGDQDTYIPTYLGSMQ